MFDLRRLAAACLLLAALWPSSALADGGQEQVASVRAGEYTLRIFTPPDPITTGTADVSVLVQRAGSSELVSNARVTVTAEPSGHEGETRTFPATHDNATDKRYYAANVRLPSDGDWRLTVRVEGPLGPAETSFQIHVARVGAVTPALLVWAALVLVALALVGQRLRSQRSSASPTEPRSEPT
jgi:hypothetical protein